MCPTDPQYPSAITLAEQSGQALQTELLRLNEFTGNGQVVDRLAINLTCMLLMVCLFVYLCSSPTLPATISQ